jgi:hypothetical protein
MAKKPVPTFSELMRKLNDMYNKEDIILNEINKLKIQLNQIKEDQTLLEMIIMHQSNKESRKNNYKFSDKNE